MGTGNDSHEAQVDLEASRSYLESVLRAASQIGIIATNVDGVITVFNSGAEEILGYSADELIGKHTPAIFHLEQEVVERGLQLSQEKGRDVAGFEAFVAVARETGVENRSWTYVRKDGEHRNVRLSVTTIRDAHQQIIGYLGTAIDITERLQAEEAARLANDRFSGAFRSAAQGMALVSLEGRWMEVNPALCQMLGYDEPSLLASDFQSITHHEDLDADLGLLGETLAGKRDSYQMEKRYFHQNGELVYVLLSVSLVRDKTGQPLHFVSQIQDVTDRRRALDALEANRTFLQQLYDSLADAVLVIDDDTKVISLNRAASELLALPEDAHNIALSSRLPGLMERIDLLNHTNGPTAQPLQQWRDEVAQGEKSARPVEVRLSSTLGNERRWVVVAQDLSERERNDRIRREFVSTVSHELRTPLTSIKGSLNLINGGALGDVPTQASRMLEIAERNASRLSNLVNDLLDLDKLESGSMRFQSRTVALSAVLDDCIAQMQGYAEPFGVTLIRCGDEDVRITVDPDRLVQVINNLLSNACKHAPRGSQVRLELDRDKEDEAIVSVIDQGAGIPKEFRDRIFQRFAQADGSDSRKQGGTGLGLAVTKELVEAMGGIIGFEPDALNGAHFWIRFPRAEAPRLNDTDKPRVLHVEDDADFADMVAMALRPWCHTEHVATIADAKQALADNAYSLVLLDLQLADGNGSEMVAPLEHAGTPTLVLSGFEMPVALAPHVAGVVNKGRMSPEALKDSVLAILRDAPAPRVSG
jgi:PAS domain S-box-containing protein